MRHTVFLISAPLLVASCATDDIDQVSSAVVVNRVGILGAGPPCQYLTVSAAIAAASAGATILVEQGQTFPEQLGLINKDLVIRSGVAGCTLASAAGVAGPIIDAGHVGQLAEITADVTFQQMSLVNGSVDNTPLGPGGNLWIAAGTTTLVDVAVFGGESSQPPFDFTPYGAGIHVASGATLNVEGNSLIMGNQNFNLGAGGVLVEAGATAVFRDQTRVGFPVLGPNIANQGPGGIMAMGTVELHDDAQVAWNSSSLGIGGGIYIFGGTVSLFDNVRVANNTAPHGGGIAVIDGTLHHTAGTVEIVDNDATESDGGGIWIESGVLDLQGTTLSGNEAADCGGAIYATSRDANPSVYLTGATVDGNEAGTCGGGVANLGGLFDADGNTIISNNTAGTDGGGVYQSGSETNADLHDVVIQGNAAARGGGIAALGGTTLDTRRMTIADNEATTDGGGLLIGGTLTEWQDFQGTDVTDNSAGRGGGIYANGGVLTLEHLDMERNHAETEGGGARVTVGATMHLTYGSASHNTAGTMGGGFAVPGGLLELIDVNVIGNTAATDGGGAAIANTGRIEATDVWFLTNTASGRGGGIAVLSFAASTDPQLVMAGLRNQEGCVWRGVIATNEYCSEIRANTAGTGGGGVYLEDGTELITRTTVRLNTAPSNGSAIWMRDVATGSPALAASNLLIIKNGNVANVDSVRVMGGNFVGEAITSADNLGTPFRFGAGAAQSLLQRSIVWDASNLVNSSATVLGATCTMFRAVTGSTVGANIVFGLDPLFVTTARGKYRLGAVSMNAVDQCTLGLPVDLDSDARPVNVLYDRGAFEKQ